MYTPQWWRERFREIRALLIIVILEQAMLIALVVMAIMGHHR